jgi:HD-GYP domain-containing protein (c-di-GMP phosphodiesterase class II)
MVAEVAQAMLSHRPYRAALSLDTTIEELTSNSGKLYDEQVVNACLKILPEDFG